MKTSLASMVRHWVTFLLTAASLWLIGALALTGSEAAVVKEALSELATPLAALVTLLLIAGWRMALAMAATFFHRVPPLDDKEIERQPRGGGGALVVLCMAAACLGALPSCAKLPAVPWQLGISTPDGVVGYSSKAGIRIELHSNK